MQPAYGGSAGGEQLVEPRPSVGTQSKENVEITSAPGMKRFSLMYVQTGAELVSLQPLPSAPQAAAYFFAGTWQPAICST